MQSELADINLLARGASNAKWHSGCLAPDRCVESICDWLIRGPLFFDGRKRVWQTSLSGALWRCPAQMVDKNACPALNEVSSHSPDGRLRSIRNTNFSQNVLHVLFHRLVADAERLGNFFVSEAKSKLLKDFTFPLGQ
jgi:hypothetical protein